MFTNTSWTNYIVIVALLLIAYYLIIWIRYYFEDTQDLLSRLRKSTPQPIKDKYEQQSIPLNLRLQDQQALSTKEDQTENDEESWEQITELVIRLKEVIATAVEKKYIKEELVFAIHHLLKEYPTLRNSSFQESLNDLIVSECEKYGSIHLSAEERVMLWKEVV